MIIISGQEKETPVKGEQTMRYDQVRQIYFSAMGTTKKIIETVSRELAGQALVHPFKPGPPDQIGQLGPNDLAVVGMPVFSGRIPAFGAEYLAGFKGRNTPVVVVAVYGNRAYEDALIEMSDILKSNGFKVIGAAAFIARHSIFPDIAAQRPDADDLKIITQFGCDCARKLSAAASPDDLSEVTVKGNRPYREVGPGALKPVTGNTCTFCGVCVDICPVQALKIEVETLVMNNDLCNACTACIYACPEKARFFHGPQYEGFGPVLRGMTKDRREPEIFI